MDLEKDNDVLCPSAEDLGCLVSAHSRVQLAWGLLAVHRAWKVCPIYESPHPHPSVPKLEILGETKERETRALTNSKSRQLGIWEGLLSGSDQMQGHIPKPSPPKKMPHFPDKVGLCQSTLGKFRTLP